MIFLRPIQGLSVLEVLKRLESGFLRCGKVPVEDFLFGAFVCLKRELMAPRIASIYLLDPGQKVESGFGLYGNRVLDDLLLGVYLTAILLGLGTNKEL